MPETGRLLISHTLRVTCTLSHAAAAAAGEKLKIAPGTIFQANSKTPLLEGSPQEVAGIPCRKSIKPLKQTRSVQTRETILHVRTRPSGRPAGTRSQENRQRRLSGGWARSIQDGRALIRFACPFRATHPWERESVCLF